MDQHHPLPPPALGARPEGTQRTRRVFVDGLELIGQVGVYEHERRHKQRVVVSLKLTVADYYDGVSDQLGQVYDYDEAIETVRRIVHSGHFNLIETLAEAIAAALLANPVVDTAQVTIAKPDVLPACRSVGIEIERRRV